MLLLRHRMQLLLIAAFLITPFCQAIQESESSPKPHPESLHANRLIHEKSPYLLLHAHNPVDWYPWGEEAFSKARRENKPIFLSIGYYSCHWCHVMERESFSDPEIAALLNRSFVSIKVDREERPDIDRAYMTFAEASTGKGGWPLNVFLTPQLKPFFAGIYFPPRDRDGQNGFMPLLNKLAETWKKRQDEIQKSTNGIISGLQALVIPPARTDTALNTSTLERGYQQIKQSYDVKNAGFGSAQKFPHAPILEFLLHDYKRSNRNDSLAMALKSLQAMAAGGLQDQLGGGFHRYTTDPEWRLPHFEKMLVDQSQIAILYLEAFQITHDRGYAEVARKTLDFVMNEMRAPSGGYYSSLDADTLITPEKKETGEGSFYLWQTAEIEKILGPNMTPVFNFRFGIKPEGNVSSSQSTEDAFKLKNVLRQEHTLEETSKQFGLSLSETATSLDAALKKLADVRETRPLPQKDIKIITAWNGLMISAFAKASSVLNEKKYLDAAIQLANFLEHSVYDQPTGNLKREYYESGSAIGGFVEDYAFLVQGLLDLYEASFDTGRLRLARRLQARQDQLFWDQPNGGYLTSGTDKSVLLRTKTAYDTDEPSANAISALNLLRLWQYTDDESLKQKAERTLTVFTQPMAKTPDACASLLTALDFSLGKHQQIVIVGELGQKDAQEMLALAWSKYLPNRILMFIDKSQVPKDLDLFPSSVKTMPLKDGKATAYICENYACKRPTNDLAIVERLLDEP